MLNTNCTQHSEETILVNRALRDDPSKGTMHNRQAITPRLLLKALSDYHLWPMFVPDTPTPRPRSFTAF